MHKIVENYILYESIGAGQYGKVYRAKNTKTNETVAVKAIPLDKFKDVPKLEEFTANEIKTLNRIKNVNVIRFIEMLKTANNMYLVYEYCDGGTLEDYLQKKHHFSEAESLKFFAQLMNAFKAIYKENILHRDLKPSNILMHNNQIKIADFGFCKKMSSAEELTFTMVGSPIYMAPEVLKGYPYNIKADVWSLGVVLYEMLYGICPYEEKTLPALISQIDSRPLSFHPDINRISPNTENLLRRMLTHDHRSRMAWAEVVNYDLKLEAVESGVAPSIGGGIRLDLDEVNKFNDQYNFKQQAEEKIVKTLMKERNKIGFISNVLHTILEMNLSTKTAVAGFMVLKRLHQLLDSLKRDISIENTSSRFSTLDKWGEFQNSDEFIAFSRYINEEYDEAQSFLNIFKQEVNALSNSNPNDPDLKDTTFKLERGNTAVDLKFLHSAILNYVEEVKAISQDPLKASDDGEVVKLFTHMNEVLDIDNLDDFFDKTLEAPALKLSEQPYFANLKKMSRDKLQDMVNMKLTSSKMKLV